MPDLSLVDDDNGTELTDLRRASRHLNTLIFKDGATIRTGPSRNMCVESWRARAFPATRPSSSQQRADLIGGVVNFDLEPRMGRLQLPTRCFSSLDSVEL
jgi:hypothetical protein